ncbi:signal peptidase I SipW [Effusibacillus consociatus]|uniref:Signal peptidase I n=1 Tax=Effusibacillus consociatus TaxID=1117041 RepID=A0ABV9PWW1_9BACL
MKVKKWISRITTGVLSTILLMTLTMTVSARFYGGIPKIFGYELLTVLSGSMEPSIHTGSIIAIRPTGDPTNFQVGEVITYRSLEEKNSLITHRILEVKGSGPQVEYVTKGDNNASQDPKPISAANVVGQFANFSIPLLGYVFTFAKSKFGIISLLVVPGMLLIIWQMLNLWRTIVQEPSQNV